MAEDEDIVALNASDARSSETETESRKEEEEKRKEEEVFDLDLDLDDYFDALSDDQDSETDSDSEISEEKKTENLRFELGVWASSFGVSVVALSALLSKHTHNYLQVGNI